MKVVCISGSPSPTAWSYQLLLTVVDGLTTRGCAVEIRDLRAEAVPMVDTVEYNGGGAYTSGFGSALRAQVEAADGIVLATSVHHASYSGLLKSALDHLPGDAFTGRPVALLANAGAARGATIACEHLRSVVKAMGGWSTPTQVASAAADFDPESRALRTAGLVRRCATLCDEVVMFAQATAGLRLSHA